MKPFFQRMAKLTDKTTAALRRLCRWDLLAFLVIVSLAAFYLRYVNFPFESADYKYFLKKWYDSIDAAGGFRGIGQVYGNYTPPYMYLMALMTYLPVSDLVAIKLFSILFDYLLAFFVGLLVKQVSGSKVTALMAYTATLFLPTVFFNSALWAQCDSIFVTFLIMSLYFMLREKDCASMISFGLAFSFKLQAIFFIPVLLLALLKKRIRFRAFLLAPLVFFLLGLPAVIMGMRFSDAYGVYFLQASYYPQINLNAPNLYVWWEGMFNYAPYEGFESSMVWFAFGAVGCAMLPLYKTDFSSDDRHVWILITAFFAAFMPFVLPHMHERYWYFSDILALILLFCRPKEWYLSLLIFLPSLYAVCIYLFYASHDALAFFALLMLAGICLLGAALWKHVKSIAKA